MFFKRNHLTTSLRDEILEQTLKTAKFQVLSGTVISCDIVPITEVRGSISGGGGNLDISGHIAEVSGWITSSTQMVAQVFVKFEEGEVSLKIDANQLPVREGSSLEFLQASSGGSAVIYAIRNTDTKKAVFFGHDVRKFFSDRVKSCITPHKLSDPVRGTLSVLEKLEDDLFSKSSDTLPRS